MQHSFSSHDVGLQIGKGSALPLELQQRASLVSCAATKREMKLWSSEKPKPLDDTVRLQVVSEIILPIPSGQNTCM
jgi:hypothetical protein